MCQDLGYLSVKVRGDPSMTRLQDPNPCQHAFLVLHVFNIMSHFVT